MWVLKGMAHLAEHFSAVGSTAARCPALQLHGRTA